MHVHIDYLRGSAFGATGGGELRGGESGWWKRGSAGGGAWANDRGQIEFELSFLHY